MKVPIDEKDLEKLILVGDRILIKPKTPQSKTKSGLYLPPGVHENEKYVVVSQSSILLLLRDEGLFE